MEDVLDLYMQPYDEQYPVICMDEKPFQLTDEWWKPIPMKPLKPLREDSEYIRKGTCSIFVFTEPLGSGGTCLSVRIRTKLDWAQEIKELLEVHYPDADEIRLVMDNLNTHNISSLYEAFEPEVARRLARRLEIHYIFETWQLVKYR